MQLDSEFKTFSDSCIYQDHPRIRASEHFLNLPRDSKGLSSDGCPPADACVLTAILSDFKVLQAKENTDASRLIALKSLGHWVGDIHQPLHVSFLDAKRGNVGIGLMALVFYSSRAGYDEPARVVDSETDHK